MTGKPICLIGGGGFIGSRFRSRLAARHVPVVVVGRSPASDPAESEIWLNVEDWQSVREELTRHNFAAIVDLASTSLPNTSYEHPARDISDNVGRLLRHLDLCAGLRTEKFVFFSSGGTVYGEGAGRPSREDDPLFPLSPYGITKIACERFVWLHHLVHRLPAIVVRPSNVYGPGQIPFSGQGIVSTAFAAAFTGAPFTIFGDGSNVRDYLYVDDMCAALERILDHADAGSILNIGSGQGVSVNDLLGAIGQLAAEKGIALEIAMQPARPFDVKYNVLDTARLRATVPWQPETGLHEGLVETRDWIERFLTDRSSPS